LAGVTSSDGFLVTVVVSWCWCAEKLMLGLPSAVTVINDLDDAAAVAAAASSHPRSSIPAASIAASCIPAPVITHTAATPQDSPKDRPTAQLNNIERSSSLQLPHAANEVP